MPAPIPSGSSHIVRKRFCDFSTSLLAIADTLRSLTNRVSFLLGCAYYRATKRFFPVQYFPKGIDLPMYTEGQLNKMAR